MIRARFRPVKGGSPRKPPIRQNTLAEGPVGVDILERQFIPVS
jgi:hypothetical protein